MKTNKEVADKLTEYFKTKDINTISRMLANCFVDLNRFINFQHLNEEDKDILWTRIHHNMSQVNQFLASGNNEEDLSFKMINEEEKE